MPQQMDNSLSPVTSQVRATTSDVKCGRICCVSCLVVAMQRRRFAKFGRDDYRDTVRQFVMLDLRDAIVKNKYFRIGATIKALSGICDTWCSQTPVTSYVTSDEREYYSAAHGS